MKKAIILLLVLSMLLLGGCAGTTSTQPASSGQEITADSAVQDVGSAQVSDQSDVEIGEMV